MTTSFAVIRLDGTKWRALSAPPPRAMPPRMGTGRGRPPEEMTQDSNGSVDPGRRMSVINAPRPLATGIDTAVLAMKKAQDRLAMAAYDVSRQSAAIGESSTKEGQRPKLPAQVPPNPGPPGGAVPGDLAQAMIRQNRTSVPPQAEDLLEATVDQRLASHDFSANVKTVQAFDAMLEELSRIKQPQANESLPQGAEPAQTPGSGG